MQPELISELNKNKNNVFMSKELEDIMSKDLSAENNCSIILFNESIKGSILKLEESKKKLKVVVETLNKDLTCFKLNNFSKLIFSNRDVIDLEKSLLSYKAYLYKNKCILKLKLTKERENNCGI